MDPSKRAHRIFHLLVVVTLLLGMLNWSVGQSAAQDNTGTPAASEESASDQAAPESTNTPAETPTDAANWQFDATATPPPTDTPEAPTEPVIDPTATTPPTVASIAPTAIQPDTPTATVSPTATTAPVSAAGYDTGVLVTVSAGDQNGPRVAGVCMTLVDHSILNLVHWSACTDANGQALLYVMTNLASSAVFTIRIEQPGGYFPTGDILISATPDQITSAALVLYPLPPVTDTLKAVDGGSGNPIGGVCWSYFANNNGVPGALVTGPNCDTDNDGTTTVTDLTPATAFCLVVTPPSGYQVIGSNTICSTGRSDGQTTVKAFSATSATGSGSTQIVATTQWGAPLANVCASLALTLNSQSFAVTSGCTDAAGIVTLTGLVDGAYTVSALSWPAYFDRFTDATFTISGGNASAVPITVPSTTIGTFTLKTLLSYGPQMLGGVCWSYVLNEGGAPGATVLAGPVCDSDGDGIVTISGAPSVPFCLVATPPTGFYRPDGNYAYCQDAATTLSATLTFGMAPIPVTPTPSPSVTVTPPTPTPTQTPPPTPTPAPNEPNGNVLVRNCAADYPQQDGSIYLNADMCYTVGAGIRFGVFQQGAQVGEVTTGANGTFGVALPSREPFELHYLDGNNAIYVPFSGQESLQRYGASGQFIFVRDPSVDRTWTLTVNVVSANGGEANQPLGGACFRIVDNTGAERLPTACDTDNDGVVVMGQLPPADVVGTFGGATHYFAVMTQAPPGYDLFSGQIFGGAYDPANPNSWTASYSYKTNSLRIHFVDPSGNPVPGFCFGVPDWVYGGTLRCDGAGSSRDGVADGAADGVVVVSGVTPGRSAIYTIHASPPGYLADSQTQTYTLTTDVFTDVYWPVHAYGSSQANQADVLFRLVATDPTVDSFDYAVDFTKICFSLSPNQGQVPTGVRCPSKDGEILYRNVPQGAYTLKLEYNFSFCVFPAVVAATTSVTVGAGDLGTQKVVTIPVDGCGHSGGSSCTALRTVPTGRTVDAYYGTLTDSNGNAVLNTLQLSETVSREFTHALLGSGNIDPAHLTSASLAPWTEQAPYLSGAPDWVAQPDWDGNAYQGMVNAYGQASGNYVLGERISRGSQAVVAGFTTDLIFTNPETFRQDYPDLTDCPADTEDLLIFYAHTNTLNLYELNATEPAPVTPSPTPYASPEPLCNTTVYRNVTAYYGTLVDDHGDVVLTGLALSDHIPPALRAAVVNGDPPGNIGGDIGNWVGASLLDESWAESPHEGLDAEGNLRGQLASGGSDVRFGTPSAGQTVEYRFTTYRYLDLMNLPVGCSPDFSGQSGFRSAAISVLIPVTQETVVQITYVELNASLGAAVSPTATATAGPSVTPTGTAQPTVAPTTAPAGPTATTNPSAVTGLPNTGAQPAESARDELLFTALALLLGLLAAAMVMAKRQRR